MPRRRKRGAIYARFSSRWQDSIDDQVEACRKWAEANDIEILDEHVYYDKAVSGRKNNRPGFHALNRALERKEVDVLVVFATGRLYRKNHKAVGFVEEEVVERGLRCVFVSSGVDTDDKKRWRMLLKAYSLIDEVVLEITAAHVRAAHIGQLKRGIVFGTNTYGFTGEPIPDQFTRQGRPLRRLVIDRVAAAWVVRIFEWFTRDGLSIQAIVRRLNEQAAPLPERSVRKRWTYPVVRRVLGNCRATGNFDYGRTETIWQSKADYARQTLRDAPLEVVYHDHLRIIDDATFDLAQQKLADYRRRAGRPPIDGDRRSRPRLLNAAFRCPKHGASLWAGGSHGHRLACHACRAGSERVLFSTLPRELATRLVIEAVAGLLQPIDAVVDRVVESCRRQAQGLQTPDESELVEKRRDDARLTNRIGFIMDAPGDTDEDREENQVALAEARRQRVVVREEIKRLEAAMRRVPKLPTHREVRELFSKLGGILSDAVASDDHARVEAAKRIILTVTGGEIFLSQMGDPQRGKGWLRGSFSARPVRAICEALGVPPMDEEPVEVVIDFRVPTLVETLAEPVVALLRSGVLRKAIPPKLVEQGLPKVSRALVARAIQYWHTSRGLPVPDGRAHSWTTGSRSNEPALHLRVAAAVMDLWRRDVALSEIAKQLGIDRNVVTAAVRHWHESRGMPVPDGRSRRKALRLKRNLRDAA